MQKSDPEKVRVFTDWVKAVPNLVDAVLALDARVKSLEQQVADLTKEKESE